MKRNGRNSLFKRLLSRESTAAGAGAHSTGHAQGTSVSPQPSVAGGAERRLSGAELEQAYRNLMMENLVLSESNQRLHERLARREEGLEESPAARELIRAQRNALAERSHRMRELEYENKQLQRERKKWIEENERLLGRLQQLEGADQRGAEYRRELAEVKAALRAKTNELLTMTDRYYQLEARLTISVPTTSAANGDF